MLRNRLSALLALLVVASMVLAACGGTATEAPAVEETEAPAVEETEAPAAEVTDTEAKAESPKTTKT